MATTTIHKTTGGSYSVILSKGLISSLPHIGDGTKCELEYIDGKFVLTPII